MSTIVKIRVLLVDDHAVLRRGVRNLIEAEGDMEVVGEADDGSTVLGSVQQLSPDVVVLDYSMTGQNGAETVRELRKADQACKILILTLHEDPGYLRETLESGALGYILKRSSPAEIVQAIRAVAMGNMHIDARLAEKLICTLAGKAPQRNTPASALTEREQEVLRAIAEGYSMKEIAARMEISVKTVETYKARGMEKLDLRSRVDIVRVAREAGWLNAISTSA